MNEIRETVGLSQHHDAISGTSTEHAADDYINRLINSINKTNHIILDCLNKLDTQFKIINNNNILLPSPSNDFNEEIYKIKKNEDLYITLINPGVNEAIYPISLSVNSSYIQLFEVDEVSLKETEIESDIFCQNDDFEKCSVHFFAKGNFENYYINKKY